MRTKAIKKWKGLRRITVGYKYYDDNGQEVDVHGRPIQPDMGRRGILGALVAGPASVAVLKVANKTKQVEKGFHDGGFYDDNAVADKETCAEKFEDLYGSACCSTTACYSTADVMNLYGKSDAIGLF
jgi:hypothetical protein